MKDETAKDEAGALDILPQRTLLTSMVAATSEDDRTLRLSIRLMMDLAVHDAVVGGPAGTELLSLALAKLTIYDAERDPERPARNGVSLKDRIRKQIPAPFLYHVRPGHECIAVMAIPEDVAAAHARYAEYIQTCHHETRFDPDTGEYQVLVEEDGVTPARSRKGPEMEVYLVLYGTKFAHKEEDE